jgi:acyl dehydratase
MPADWSDLLGRRGDPVPGPYPVGAAALGYLAEALEDERLATAVEAGGDVPVPLSFVTVASRVPNWRPKSAAGHGSIMLAMSVPVQADSAVNVAVDQTYRTPLRLGDRVTSTSVLTGVEERETRLGPGFMITETIEHSVPGTGVVARTANTVFRFRARPTSSAGAGEDAPATIPESDFEPVVLPVTMTRLALAAGAMRDYSPIHHDVDAARAAGHPTAFLNYTFQMALMLRALGEWTGTDRRVRRLRLRLRRPVYLGRTVSCTGVRDPAGPAVRVGLHTEDGLCSTAVADLHLDDEDAPWTST